MFATGGWDGSPSTKHPIKIWDTKTGKLVATLKGHTDSVTCLAWTPDGETLISGSADYSIRTWNTLNWKQITVLDEHTHSVLDIAISPNGCILASASWDKTARLWNLENTDGKLLATCCSDDNTYTWNVSKEAILNDLLLDNSLLTTDATRHQPIKVANRVPQGFFDETPNRAHSSAQHRLHPISSPYRGSTIRSRLLSLFHSVQHDAHNTPSRPSGTDIELHEHPSEVVDVPYAKGKRRNASARERRKPLLRIPTPSSSRPPNSTVTQQSSGAVQAQSSSQPHAAVSASIAPSVVANTTLNTNPHATIKHAGRWARFSLFICCTSPEYTDGHH